VVATLRGERDIAVGNVIGSNIFNILFVLGTTSALSGGVRVGEASLGLDLPVMTSAAVLCLPIFFTDGRISRGEGALFLGYYLAYTGYLIITAGKDHQAASSGGLVWGLIAFFTVIVTLFSLICNQRIRRAG
jgi:cation:H+ antiporter